LRKTRHRGVAGVGWMFTLAAAAYNLRMRTQTVVTTSTHAKLSAADTTLTRSNSDDYGIMQTEKLVTTRAFSAVC
jgi:hypothetical protein